MDKYIFTRHQDNKELARLKALEKAFDKKTKQLLKTANIKSGDKCLEVGAGAGSILEYMANKVGKSGLVIGLDKDTRFINHLNNPPIKIITSTIQDLNLEDKFDLIHIRYVLIHNQNPVELIAQISKYLKTGGKLIIEEPDFTTAKWIDKKYQIPANRVNNAMNTMFKKLSLNPAYGSEMIFDLEKQGLSIEKTEANLHFERGDSAIAKVMAQSAEALKEKYIETGKTKESDISAYIKGANDSNSLAIYYSTISIISRNSI